jgi:hypothetical protein
VPNFLAQINIDSTILAIIYFTIIFIFTFTITSASMPLLKKHRKRLFLYPFTLFLMEMLCFTAIIGYFYPDHFLSLMSPAALLVAGVIILSDFIIPLLKFRSFKNLKDNIIGDRARTNKKAILSISFPENSYFNLSIIASFILFLSYLFTSAIGHTNASLNSQYYVFQYHGQNYALIRNYEDEKIAVKYKADEIIPGDLYIFKTEALTVNKKNLKLPNSKSSFWHTEQPFYN